MTGGRWFTASNMQGPWTFATPSLPADFAHIPPSSPAAQVLSSVPGTEEAKDAVMIAQVPTKITVNSASAAAQASVTYAGAPQFAPIEGTSMSYATNTAQKVIQVGEFYYLCLTGIWFVSASPAGPWQIADSRSSSDLHDSAQLAGLQCHLRYASRAAQTARCNPATPLVTWARLLSVSRWEPSSPAARATTIRRMFIIPVTAIPSATPIPLPTGHTSYYHSTTGAYGVSQTAYGPYGSATRSASYNPYTGTSTHTASVYTAYGTRKPARPTTRTPVRPLPRIKVPTATAPGEVPKGFEERRERLLATLLHRAGNHGLGADL